MRLLKKGYVFFQNLDSTFDEIHIHEANYDRPSQEIKYDPVSVCGKHDEGKHKTKMIKSIRNGRNLIFFNESEARDYAAELQNSEKEVCGICVSHLYYSAGSE